MMRKNLIKLTLLGVFISGCAFATEMRSPWLSERGSIGYRLEKGNPDKYSLNIFSIGYVREAHKAFMKHSTDTKPLSTLFFNKSDFAIGDAFPNKTIPLTAKHYNPFLTLNKIHPRVTYYEWGMNIGGRFEYPVFKDKGRVGLRTSIPFRCIEIERENITDQSDNPLDDVVLTRMVKLETTPNSATATTAGGTIVERAVKIYNLGFVSNLYDDASQGPMVEYAKNSVRIAGQQCAATAAEVTNGKKMNSEIAKFAGVIYNEVDKNQPQEPGVPSGIAADGYDKYRWANNFSDNVARNFTDMKVNADGTSAAAALQDNYAKGISFFVDNQDYAPFAYNARTQTQVDQLKKMWIALGWTIGNLTSGAKSIDDAITLAAERAKESPYQWLYDAAGYEMETSRRSSLGDIDLDLLFEYMFSDEWVGEVFLGLRFPTGVNDDYCNNPYNVHTGNGEHWEIRFGGLVAWEPLSWLNVKLDLTGAYAFEGTENRCAVFEGSDVKNIGPCVGADVDWWYFITRLDFNFFHPKTKDISSTLGYEFYYKTKDDIHFKRTQMTPFYGDNNDGTSNAANLSNSLAEKNTESIAHKIRFEGQYQLCPWLQAFAGGSYTFAGQYVQREGDAHCGVNVKF
ncbi:hypothetical protein ACFLYH_00940 [Candidatus Dependentiae bacterium]